MFFAYYERACIAQLIMRVSIEDKDELRKLAEQHRRENARRLGILTFKTKTGIHAQTNEERRESSHLGLLALGIIPFTKEELLTIGGLLELKEFGYAAIADVLNSRYHLDERVRTERSVAEAYLRHLKKLRNA